jgi:hydrogenase/urease accessory protein HupE
LPLGGGLALFVMVGLIHGYALGESIYGAERTPLAAYPVGLAVIQSAVALAAMGLARAFAPALPASGLRCWCSRSCRRRPLKRRARSSRESRQGRR